MDVHATGKPVLHKEAYNRPIAAEIQSWFEEAIFAPIQCILAEHGIALDPQFQVIAYDEFGRENAAYGTLERAIRAGTVQYADGRFTGKFSAQITKDLRELGARFDIGSGTFKLAAKDVPYAFRPILYDAAATAGDVSKQVVQALSAAAENIASAPLFLNFNQAINAITADLGKQFVASVAAIGPADIGITPEIDPILRAQLDANFNRNLDLAVKNFAQQEIIDLRALVEENATKFGGRTDRLAKIIESRFGVTRRKAEFLADQETGLFVAQYREQRYLDAGITRYRWSTSKDNRVRDTHRHLEGKEFTFKDGANVSARGQPARYLNPGEDWRCRCVPIVIIDLKEIAA